MPRGGYRQPANPAPVSGPGAMSARTDGQPMQDLPNAKYGENADYRELQSGAPLASAQTAMVGGSGRGLDMSQIVGLGEPTTQPETPVTDGAATGDGAGREALGLPRSDKQEEARALAKWLPVMISVADTDDATPAFKRYVRELIANQ